MVDKHAIKGYNQHARKNLSKYSICTICWNGASWCIERKEQS